MKIVQAKGQTANQIWTYASLLMESMVTKEKIVILSPDISLKQFPNFYNSKYFFFPFYSKRFSNFIGYRNYINCLQFLLANKFSIRIYRLFFFIIPGVRFIEGKVNSVFPLKRNELLLNVFKPDESICKTVESIIKGIRSDNCLIVGVHIRLGDYKTYLNGKYYYSIEQYTNVMMIIKEIFNFKKVIFLLSSNEKIDFSNFKDFLCFNIPQSSPIKDLYALSMTDYIVGPPSTFSGWASFYGNVPLYFIENPNYIFNITDFDNISNIWA